MSGRPHVWGGLLGLVALLAAGLGTGASARAGNLPDWVASAVARLTPAWAARAPAVRLVDEEEIVLPRSGRTRYLVREALRVLSAAGKDRASLTVPYLRGSSDVSDLHAWVVDPHGDVSRFGRRDAVDLSLSDQYTLYSDARALTLSAGDPAVGTVFAWEYVLEEEPFLAQWRWFFQTGEPSLVSCVSLTLPEGLEPAVVRFGPDSVVASHRDRTWTWERRDIPAVPNEALASSALSNQSVLTLGLKGTDSPGTGASFADWPGVARWTDARMPPPTQPNEFADQVARLTAGVADTLARLRAIARSAQALNYVAVDLGLGHGGGYVPHPAADVLRLGYGDCKDKANLLRALLAADGARAWMLLVSSRDRDRVEERWPSPMQFDHCILAVRVPRSVHLPAVFEHPVLGPLLAFDPTDPLTAFGDLPAAEQGALGLLVATEGGGLVRLPAAPPEANRFERRIDATLQADGSLTARLVERSVGQQAVEQRATRHRLSDVEYRRTVEAGLAASVGSVELSAYHTSEDTLAGRFRLEAEYQAPRFARDVQGQIVFGSRLAPFPPMLDLPDSARVLPVALDGQCVAETVVVALPEGYVADELPRARHDHADFADLDAEWTVDGGALRFTRLWTLRPLTLPAERYRDVRKMLAERLAVLRAPVVLVRR